MAINFLQRDAVNGALIAHECVSVRISKKNKCTKGEIPCIDCQRSNAYDKYVKSVFRGPQ